MHVQVRWFVEVLSAGLVPGFTGLVHSKTLKDAQQAKEKLDHCLKVWSALPAQGLVCFAAALTAFVAMRANQYVP